jgi:hypothetical protein
MASVATTRQEARDRGLDSYTTGKLCVWGHRSPRRASDGQCRACVRANKAAYGVLSRRQFLEQRIPKELSSNEPREFTRIEALRNGEKSYRPAKPCKACGERERDPQTRKCIPCLKAAKLEQRQVKARETYERGDRWERREQELRNKFQSRLW